MTTFECLHARGADPGAPQPDRPLFEGLQTTRPLINFVRVMRRKRSRNPLGRSGGPSRFSPLQQNQGPNGTFGIVYVADDPATAVYETLIRDRFDLDPSRT